MRRILLASCLLLLSSSAFADDVRFFGPSWADSSGRDGKGGVSIVTVGTMHNLVLAKDACKEKIDSQTMANHADWAIFDSDEGDALSFEFTYITTGNDKFWAKLWAGGGIAFNRSWGTKDVTGAKYLVMWVKASDPGIDFDVSLISAAEGSESGAVMLSDFADGKKIGTSWTKVIIPLQAIPALSKVKLSELKTIHLVHLAGTYPENKPAYLRFGKIYFSDSDLVTPVENLGWIKVPGGAMLVWDKTVESGIERYIVNVDGKQAGVKEGASVRRVKLPASILAGGAHVVSVASANAKQTSSFQAVTINLADVSQPASVKLAATLGRTISPYVYGQNGWGLAPETLKKLGVTLDRWGGNATTNYNWKDDADNKGGDWFFLNSCDNPGAPETGKRYYKFAKDAFAGGSDLMLTIPIIGWVAKAPKKGERMSSYPLSLFPNQDKNDQGAGNGFLPGGKEMIWDNDPSLNYIPSTPDFQKEWVKTCIQNFGSASKGGVKFYSMDNEPGLWRWNHRDVRPKGVGSEELVNLNATYSAMVKSVDPDAKVLGMVSWGAMELAGSDWDYMANGQEGYKLGDKALNDTNKWTDRKKHGNMPQAAYFLSEMRKRSEKAGVRLLDYFDNHGFPEVWGKNAKGENMNVLGDLPYDPVLTPQQFDASRILWDDTFISEGSWCYAYGNAPYLWTPWVGLIPKLRKMIDENYPGTKLAMTEYYPASSHYYHGALLVAVTHGIFNREGMDLACDWGSTWEGNWVFLGHKLYSNYDGKGSKVLGNYVDAASSSPDLYSFGSKQGSVTRLVLVNKNHDKGFETTVNLPAAATTYNTFVLSETLGKRIYEMGSQPATGASLKVSVPAFSAVLVVAQ